MGPAPVPIGHGARFICHYPMQPLDYNGRNPMVGVWKVDNDAKGATVQTRLR